MEVEEASVMEILSSGFFHPSPPPTHHPLSSFHTSEASMFHLKGTPDLVSSSSLFNAAVQESRCPPAHLHPTPTSSRADHQAPSCAAAPAYCLWLPLLCLPLASSSRICVRVRFLKKHKCRASRGHQIPGFSHFVSYCSAS